jgi:hypothetical protein
MRREAPSPWSCQARSRDRSWTSPSQASEQRVATKGFAQDGVSATGEGLSVRDLGGEAAHDDGVRVGVIGLQIPDQDPHDG